MSNHHTYVRRGDRAKGPQLPSFCRTRRPITTTVRVSSLQQLHWLLLLVVFLQLSTILLVVGAFPVRQQPEEIPFAERPRLAALFSSQPIPAPMNTSTGEAPGTKGAPFQCAAGR
jgi:hypothetical protein